MQPSTPKRISEAIQSLCLELSADCAPQYVGVRFAPDAQALDCFMVVERLVAVEGGDVCYGWRIWELPWLYIEAEFHAVWRTAAGELVDVTPPPVGVRQTLFVSDPSRVYEGRQVNNVRRALTTDPAIEDFFRAADDEFEFWNRGERAYQHGEIALSKTDTRELMAIQERKVAAMWKLARAFPNPGRNDPCPCGSGRKYKKCCASLS